MRAFPLPERVSTLRSQIDEFMSCRQQNVIAWRSLLGRLSSLCLLVPGRRLRLHSLQLGLWHRWGFVNESVVVPWTPEIELDLLWWYDTDHLPQSVSLVVQHPILLFWSDATDPGWGSHLHDHFVVHGPVSGSPIYCEGPECSGRLPEPSSPGPQLGVDLGSGLWTSWWPASVALFATDLNYWLPVYFSPISVLWRQAQIPFLGTGMDYRYTPPHLLR